MAATIASRRPVDHNVRMANEPQIHENLHGRRQGRGLRPYLLIVKLFAIAVCVGTLTAVLALVFLHSPPADSRAWEFELLILGRAYRLLVIPSLGVAILMGLLLWKDHPIVFLRMRWLQTKLLVIVLCLPTLHVLMHLWMQRLTKLIPPDGDEALAEALTIRERLVGGSAAALSVAVILIILGRIKPRLGQDYGKTFDQGRFPQPVDEQSQPPE